MSELNFPTNPNIGDTWTIGTITWEWNGIAWVKPAVQPTSVIANLTVTNSISITTTTNSTSTLTGALTVAGGVGIQRDVWVGGRVNAESVKLADAVLDSSVVSLNTIDTVLVDSYSLNEYRAAKYLLQVDSGTGSTARFQISEVYLVASNTGTIAATEYGLVTTEGQLGEFVASIDVFNNVNLYFTPNEVTDKVIAVYRTAIAK